MYSKPPPVGVAVGPATLALALTGMNVVWLLLASFALFAAGSALVRIVPRREG
jgi:hypothetical protein